MISGLVENTGTWNFASKRLRSIKARTCSAVAIRLGCELGSVLFASFRFIMRVPVTIVSLGRLTLHSLEADPKMCRYSTKLLALSLISCHWNTER